MNNHPVSHPVSHQFRVIGLGTIQADSFTHLKSILASFKLEAPAVGKLYSEWTVEITSKDDPELVGKTFTSLLVSGEFVFEEMKVNES